MKTFDLVLIGAGAYLLLARPAGISGGAGPGGTRIAGPGGAGAMETPTSFSVNIPGVGSYRNVYGQGTQFSINPDFFSSIGDWFKPAPPQPVEDPTYVYEPADPWAATYYPPPPAQSDPYWEDAGTDFYA